MLNVDIEDFIRNKDKYLHEYGANVILAYLIEHIENSMCPECGSIINDESSLEYLSWNGECVECTFR